MLPLLEDKNNHLIDSLRYACEGVRKTIAGSKMQPIKYSNLGIV